MNEYSTITLIHRLGKQIVFYLKEGEELTYENIYDVGILYSEDGHAYTLRPDRNIIKEAKKENL